MDFVSAYDEDDFCDDSSTDPGNGLEELVEEELEELVDDELQELVDGLPRTVPGVGRSPSVQVIESSTLSQRAFGEFDRTLLPPNCMDTTSHDTRSLGYPVQLQETYFQTADGANKLLRIGDTVELGRSAGSHTHLGAFLRIQRIWMTDSLPGIMLSGNLFKRSSKLPGMLPRKKNEVFLVLRSGLTSNSPDWREHWITVPMNEVVRKRHLIVTNSKFPGFSYRCHTHARVSTPEEIYRNAELVCRSVFSGIVLGHWNSEASIRRISQREADRHYAVSDRQLFEDWRDEVNELDSPHSYTMTDICCGAGGFSSGASQAGFSVKAALDLCHECCETFSTNHTDAFVYNADVSDLSAVASSGTLLCDHVHFSPPCRWCSPMNTQSGIRNHDSIGGRRDEANQAVLFAVKQVLQTTKARTLTLEETFGLSRQTWHRQSFYAFVHAMVEEGWSVRWNVLDFAQYGLPSHRRRLIVYGCCPGAVLPEFPVPTYGPGTGRPYRTLNDALALVAGSTSHTHNVGDVMHQQPHAPFSGNRLVSCVLTSGKIEHPNGQRFCTLLEVASLQGFPVEYQFLASKKETRKQIGNAVPPIVAAQLMRAVKRALNTHDRELNQS